MNTAERLRQYYRFSDETVEKVGNSADRQNQKDFRELADKYDLAGGSVVENVGGKKVEYLHLKSAGEKAESPSMTLFAPMGNAAIAPNIAMRAMRLFDAHRPEQLMVFAGPSNVPNGSNKLSFGGREAAAHGDLSPMTAAYLRVLGRHGVRETVDFTGYSLGASLAQEAASISKAYGVEVRRGVFGEPANVKDRSLRALAKSFMATGEHLSEYIEASDSKPLNQATELARDDVGYALGLLRLGNIAIARYLSKNTYGTKLVDLIDSNENLAVTTVFADKSEISGIDALSSIPMYQGCELGDRLELMRLSGAHHAAADDIDLHAAVVMDGLKLADASR